MPQKTLSLLLLSAAIATAKPLQTTGEKLQLPPRIYAVVGIETNIYFGNVFLTVNPDNFIFDTDCTLRGARKGLGRNDHDRWSYTPQPNEVGTYDWHLSVYNDDGLVAEATSQLVVVPRDTGKARNLSIVVVGDSLTNAHVFPRRLRDLCNQPTGPTLSMVGTNGPKYTPGKDGIADEGWAGWTWHCFLNRSRTMATTNPMPYDRKSPFVTVVDGKPVLDLQTYIQNQNHGNPPDVVTFQLGTNDILCTNENNAEETFQRILRDAETLVAAFRKIAPQAIIGVGLVTPPSSSQDAFGNNYGTTLNRWTYRTRQHEFNARLIRLFGPGNPYRVTLIPVNAALDCTHNFPTTCTPINQGNPQTIIRAGNGVHPAATGYRQMGDAYYAWLKAQLAD